MHTPPLERLMRRSVYEDRGHSTPCLIWKGALDGYGYGRIQRGGRGGGVERTHSMAWRLQRGQLGPGLELDHLCRQRDCHELTHLEPVTHTENVLRGDGPAARNARKVRCVHGHDLSDAYVYERNGRRYRSCRPCALDRAHRAYAARLAHGA